MHGLMRVEYLALVATRDGELIGPGMLKWLKECGLIDEAGLTDAGRRAIDRYEAEHNA